MIRSSLAILMFLPAFVVSAIAQNIDSVAKDRMTWAQQHFADEGSPIPNGGVTVIPEKKMSGYDTFKAERATNKANVQQFGYIKETSPQIQSLLNFNVVSQNQLAKSGSTGSSAEGLHQSINEIQMAYIFKGVPVYEMSKTLGVAPSVTFIKGKGWAGAMQFFEKTGVGTCSYRENNLEFSHGAAIIAQEDTTYDINGKVTVTSIAGEDNAGFMYSVRWYDQHFFRELNCASPNYSVSIMQTVIELARSTDKNG